MERGELKKALRRDILDDAVPQYLYEDEALDAFLNDAQRQVCLRARALTDSTSDITRVSVPADAQRIQLDPAILAVRHASFGDSCALTGTTARRLWKREARWDVSDPGTPHFWIPDYEDGFLYFDRPLDQPRTLRMSVWRMPFDSEQMEDDEDEPIIAPHWHMDMLDWAAYRAFSSKDSELGDEKRAAHHLAMFEQKVGRLPSMTEIRLWGISPITGVPAEFI